VTSSLEELSHEINRLSCEAAAAAAKAAGAKGLQLGEESRATAAREEAAGLKASVLWVACMHQPVQAGLA
jgi:hypothetical protein